MNEVQNMSSCEIKTENLTVGIENNSRLDFQFSDLTDVLKRLSLSFVVIGEYLVIMNDKEDITFSGEPYIAMQVWLNTRTGKVICRVWNETVACSKIVNILQFTEACMSHLQGRPCIGCPLRDSEGIMREFMIVETPKPRKVSLTCLKMLTKDVNANRRSCHECLRLRSKEVKRYAQADKSIIPQQLCELVENVQDATSDEIVENMKVLLEPYIKDYKDGDGKDASEKISYPQQASQVWKTKRIPTVVGAQTTAGPLDMKCDFCDKTMHSLSYLEHIKRVHPDKQGGVFSKQCPWCGKELSYHALPRHIQKIHFWGRFRCEICYNHKVSFAKDLALHMIENHKDCHDASCPSCFKKYPVSKLEDHYKDCVIEKIREKKRKQMKCETICEICGKHLKGKSSKRDHLKNHLRDRIANGEEGLDESNLFFHCEKCARVFKTKQALRMHVLREHENVMFPCSKCNVTCATRPLLLKHERIVHSTDPKFECKYCHKRFGDKALLARHVISHEEAKFPCSHCTKVLRRPEALEEHERRYHTGEKPFPCSICGNSYVSKRALGNHMRGAHKVIGPRGGKTGWYKKDKVG